MIPVTTFAGRKVAVFGLGGSGLASCRALAAGGAQVIACDDDAERITYLAEVLRGVRRALDDGVDIRGYFVWSFLDNFEWASSYRPTFGLVKVDFKNQTRLPKDSFYWYRDLIRGNRSVTSPLASNATTK